MLRRDAEQLELERQKVWVLDRLIDVGVDPRDVRGNDFVAPLVIMAHLGRHIAAKLMQSRPDVSLQLSTAENLGHRAGRPAAPDFELKEPVSNRRVSLRKEEVVLDVRGIVNLPIPTRFGAL